VRGPARTGRSRRPAPRKSGRPGTGGGSRQPAEPRLVPEMPESSNVPGAPAVFLNGGGPPWRQGPRPSPPRTGPLGERAHLPGPAPPGNGHLQETGHLQERHLAWDGALPASGPPGKPEPGHRDGCCGPVWLQLSAVVVPLLDRWCRAHMCLPVWSAAPASARGPSGRYKASDPQVLVTAAPFLAGRRMEDTR